MTKNHPVTASLHYAHIVESANYLKKYTTSTPKFGVVLGTGMHAFTEEKAFSLREKIPYEDIPHFVTPTNELHEGKWLMGKLYGQDILIMQGRIHYYEGYSMQAITHPIRVMKAMGVEVLCVCNAAGGINPAFSLSDVMLITDHINLLPESPLLGENIGEMGPRFPDMFHPYSPRLLSVARANKALSFLKHGVYVAVMGPQLETPAEYRYLATIGADAVGMSTVPEVIVAKHMRMEVCGLSVVSDLCYPPALKEVNVAHIVVAVQQGEPKLVRALLAIIEGAAGK